MKLYLAYGANTNWGSMKVRCPAAQYVCNITLNHHQLVFRGVADVVPKRGAKAECAMWLITPECEEALDRFEGFPHLYVKKYVTMHLNGHKARVMFYIMRNGYGRRGQYAPGDGYEQCLREGYAECGLPVRQIDNAISRALAFELRVDQGTAKWKGSASTPVIGYSSRWFGSTDAEERAAREALLSCKESANDE